MRHLARIRARLAWAAAIAATAAAPAALAGEVTGTVRMAKPPKAAAEPIAVTQDHGACGQSVRAEELVVGPKGELANVVIALEDAPAREAPASAAVLDQKGCVFVPHVLAVGRRSTLEIRNSDAVLHNVHGVLEATGRALFNVAMPRKGQSVSVTLKKAGVVKLGCDAGHGWMRGYVHVFDHPYFAVTGADGSFAIPGVPPGTYRVTARHETLGTRTGTVTVRDKGPAVLNLSF